MKNKPKIGFYGISRFYRQYSEEILSIINSVYDSGQVLMGPEIVELETHISWLCHRKYAIAVNSCTDALYFALRAAGIGNNDEVLVSGFSFIASATPILRVGGIPVFVDINTDSFMMDLKDLENKITSKTKAVIAVHLFGQMLNAGKLEEIADKNGLILIEDAAQSLGCKEQIRPAGSLGYCSCISFDPTKIIGAFGNGGILLTDDKKAYMQVKQLRYHGKCDESGEFEEPGYNSRLTSAQAALLTFQLGLLDDWIIRRNEIAGFYTKALEPVNEISTPVLYNNQNHTFHKYVIKANERDKLKDYLAGKGIQTMIHYRNAIFDHPVFKKIKFRAENNINISEVKEKVLSLPVYPELQLEEAEYICNTIKEFYS